MPSLVEALPDAKTLLALTPGELGDVLLELIHHGISGDPARFNPHDILHPVNNRATTEASWGFR